MQQLEARTVDGHGKDVTDIVNKEGAHLRLRRAWHLCQNWRLSRCLADRQCCVRSHRSQYEDKTL